MRTHPILLLLVGLTCTACSDTGGLPDDNNPATGGILAIWTTTTGLDRDPDGYRVEADGTDRGVISANSVAHFQLPAGPLTVGLTGLAPNCAIDGPATQTVTIVKGDNLRIDFTIVCAATTGVIGVVTEASGLDVAGSYEALVDGGRRFPLGRTGLGYLDTVSAGDHLVSLLAPDNCTVETNPLPVAVSAGGLIRDTVEVTFAVTCVRFLATLQITAHTIGNIPEHDYIVWGCPLSGMYCWDFLAGPLGRLAPNGSLTAQVPLVVRRVELTQIPPNCSVGSPNPSPPFSPTNGSTHNIEFSVVC